MSSKSQKTSSDDADPIQIVLIGPSGSGKSSTGNTILGKKCFHSEASAKSVTLKCQTETETINGRRVTVVDTPGWDCTELTKDKVAEEIRNALQNFHGPYAYLLVIPVGPVEPEDIKKISDLEKVLGPSYLQNTTILFSRSDNLEFKTFDQFLNEGGKEFKYMLAQCKPRLHCWNNKDKRNDENVKKVLQDLKMAEVKIPVLPQSSQNKIDSGKDGDPSVQPEHSHGKRLRGESEAFTQNPEELRVLLLGMSKVGKTSSIKTLLGTGALSENKACQVFTGTKSGWNLKLIESPDFDENPKRIQGAFSRCFYESAPGPHVIVIVMNEDRFTPAKKTAMKYVYEYLGQSATKHTMVLFTGKDNLEGKPITRYIEENADLKDLVEKFGGRFHAVNNRDTSNPTEGDDLLQKIVKIYKLNEGKFYRTDEHVQHPKGPLNWISSFTSYLPNFSTNK